MKRVAFANQTRINELTEELEHLRKACGDRVKQVEIAAEKQKTEFIQLLTEIIELSQRGCWRDVQGHEINMQELLSDVLDGSGDINKDTVLMEAVRKFRNMRLSLDDENLQFIAQLKSTAEDNSEVEVNAELMMKYQSSMERVLELEKKLSDSNRKITMLETKLEEASDRLVKCQGSLWKLFYLTQGTELDQSGDKGSQSTEELKRIPAAEVVRVVGSVLHSKDIEIQKLSNRAESLQSHIEEWEAKLNTAENVKMQLEEQLKDLTKDLEERQAICDETRKQTRRLEDQLQNCENDKKMVEETRRHLEDEISNLQLQFQKLSTEGSRKIRDDAARATKAIEENYKQRSLSS
ncbi:hypothetical protein AB6A40_011542 [Gnathostoma spinigerum]|uniref:PUMA/OVT1 coiled-coil region domain-containing protein n=1 Tax=Gnathostoma spinigerum TaxID=75299 RepID=A0ABD6EXZ0_9BILA